ncbi:MAG: bifunctional tetrahydrofolate synthase/dihydrofolate synthase [Cellvibrionaceae bacterium]
MNLLSLNSSSSLSEWLHYLESLNPKEIDLGLDRVERVANQMNLFSKLISSSVKIVTVAGTNGKGSCVTALDSFLVAADKNTGAYTSPHFLDYNERIKINGVSASDEEIITAFCEVEKSRQGIPLTYFEFGTLAAMWHFLHSDVDVIVMEVGLGGRLDAVNVFVPDVAIITSIALDHQDWLGDNRETIGLAKAGIYRKDTPAICVDGSPPNSVIEYANQIKAELYLKGRGIDWSVDDNFFNWSGVDCKRNTVSIKKLPVPNLPLPSVAAAIQAFAFLGFELSDLPLEKTLQTLNLTGRGQQALIQGKNVLLDVAHNPAAALYLKEILARKNVKNIFAVFAVMADKDYKTIFTTLDAKVDKWFVSGIENVPRAESGTQLRVTLEELGLTGSCYDTVRHSFAEALAEATVDDLIVVLGSFYTVAEVLNHFPFDGK